MSLSRATATISLSWAIVAVSVYRPCTSESSISNVVFRVTPQSESPIPGFM